ncbi:hypothetical protein M3629_04990 [Paenibacillus polysaccharolyticus]|uniref:hypothetical protein n=1 Tax=Paenibacillus polysaccharolyticus TaxID=582692 RepID=UPI00203D52F5|nr:hypothetical protein [Paenibacillus polysaccharolyticus]MCM3132129.1 hypothetical protein [Paenibacillus polysaccharolyticus]
MKHKINTITKLVYNVANYLVEEKDYTSTYNKIRLLTKEVWNIHHNELLNELSKLDNSTADYQLFWLECLSWPRKSPNLKGLDGMPLFFPYSSLPSDFNGFGFHESTIDSISVNDPREVVLHIKLDSWDYQKAELTFYNVGSCFYQTEEGTIIENLGRIQDFCILSDGEVPNISFALKHLKISQVGTITDKRLFYFSGSASSNTYGSIYIFAENWNIETM